ncbi:hypothetical protein Tco_0897917 [Tanacetum coccineum]
MKSQVSELLEKLHISDQEMKQQIILFEEDKRMFLAKNEFLAKVSSSVQKEYNDLLAFNDILKQRLETKFKLLKHDNSLEKMIEMVEKEYESNFSKISITSSTLETKNLELVKEMGDKVKCFDEEKNVFETKISKLEKVLAQRVKDFDDVKTEISRRTNKFEMYFANLEKENALLKSQLASQNYTLLQKQNNDLRTSYNVLKEKHEFFCEKLEKEKNDLKMHYKRLFDSIKQKNVVSQVFTKSIPKVNVSEKIYTGKSSKPILKKVSQFTTYSLQKDRKYLKKQHSFKTFTSQNHVKNESSKQIWKRKGENISKPFKYSMNEMFSMRKRDDSVLKKGERCKGKRTRNETSSCCAQVLWMRTQFTDYGFFYDKVPIYCDSKSAIAISCNPLLSKYSYDLPEPELIYPESSFQFRKVRSRMNENDKVVKSDKNMMKKNQMISKMKRLELKSERLIRKDEGCFSYTRIETGSTHNLSDFIR